MPVPWVPIPQLLYPVHYVLEEVQWKYLFAESNPHILTPENQAIPFISFPLLGSLPLNHNPIHLTFHLYQLALIQ